MIRNGGVEKGVFTWMEKGISSKVLELNRLNGVAGRFELMELSKLGLMLEVVQLVACYCAGVLLLSTHLGGGFDVPKVFLKSSRNGVRIVAYC